MNHLARHLVLAAAESKEDCRSHIVEFFEQTSLVRYDRIEVAEDQVLQGSEPGFGERLQAGVAKNHEVLNGLLKELAGTGFERCADLSTIPQGYPSKVLHIIAHFLDGFIGIDTAFYNLVDDSHWVSEETTARLRKTPGQFWLFALDCYSMTPKEAALLHM